MNYFTPKELTANFSDSCVAKSKLEIPKLLMLGLFAGILVSFAAVVGNTATHTIVGDAGRLRMITGLLFGFGTSMAVVIGTELFTGNSVMIIGVLDKKITLLSMFRNLLFAFCGNLLGAILVAAGVAYSGQLNMSENGLAVFSMKVAIGKMNMPFGNAFLQGALCCMLIAFSVLIGSAAKDLTGKMLGAYIPIMFFVLCGFNHCVSDMYYCIVGLFAKNIPAYAAAATAAGLDLGKLNLGQYIVGNLIPVGLGNLAGGMFIGVIMWFNQICLFCRKKNVPCDCEKKAEATCGCDEK